MTTRRKAINLTITVALQEEPAPATVRIAGPHGEWTAALSLDNRDNFIGSIVEELKAQLSQLLLTSREDWPPVGERVGAHQ